MTETNGRACIAQFLEQSMKGGLVGDKTMNCGGAIALIGEAQPSEPADPSGTEVPLDADFVLSGVVMMACRCFARCAPFRLLLAWMDLRRRRRAFGVIER
jgi:hypothetical protein